MDSVTEEAECNSNWLIVIEGELTDLLIDNQIAGSDYEVGLLEWRVTFLFIHLFQRLGSVQRGFEVKNYWTSKKASVNIRRRGHLNMVAIRFS